MLKLIAPDLADYISDKAIAHIGFVSGYNGAEDAAKRAIQKQAADILETEKNAELVREQDDSSYEVLVDSATFQRKQLARHLVQWLQGNSLFWEIIIQNIQEQCIAEDDIVEGLVDAEQRKLKTTT